MKIIIGLCLIAYVCGDATSDCKAKATSCDNFYELCGAGCKGGWSAGCGMSNGKFNDQYTKCDCAKWGGVKPPKKEQSDSQWRQDAYNQHNVYRRKHGVPDAHRDAQAESVAQNWANSMARSDNFNHNSNRKGFGENIYYSTGVVEGKDAVNSWYDEVTDPGYDFNNQGFSGGTGHFTQVVWKASTGVGCGRATSSRTKRTYVCCNYNPAGNMMGDFEKNVFRGK